MALSGLEIYKRLPKTNCKKCGFPTCLAFAMQLAAKKITLDQCPYVSAEAKSFLSDASEPPVKLITIGTGKPDSVGNETVLFRHEETFYHPTLIGIEISDNLNEAEFNKKISAINKLKFERIGKVLSVNLVALRNDSGSGENYLKKAKSASNDSGLNLVLITKDPDILKGMEPFLKEKKPLLYSASLENAEKFVAIAKSSGCPLVISAENLEGLSELSLKVKNMGFSDIVLEVNSALPGKKVQDFTQIRRLALKKSFKNFGYPIISRVSNDDPMKELYEGITSVLKYANILLLKDTTPEIILPILVAREDLYTDPQKPVQVEPKIYEIGSVTDKSPVIITTNFSITYFTVASEVESSRMPSFILSVDSEGMSVLTAWAAEKFTPERIAKAIKESGILDKVSHKKMIIPGYVSMMSGKLEEESGLEILVGPREASGLPSFLKGLK